MIGIKFYETHGGKGTQYRKTKSIGNMATFQRVKRFGPFYVSKGRPVRDYTGMFYPAPLFKVGL